MKYVKPNLDHEWMEALRYREFEKMGKDGWKEIASNNYTITNYESIKDRLNNVDLDFDTLDPDKKKRFEKHFEEGSIEMPIAVKFSDDDYDLLGGNTRLSGLIGKGINPKLYIVDLSKTHDYSKEEEIDEDCWKGYKQVGQKKKGGKTVPNCVPTETKESTSSDASGAFSSPMNMTKREIYKLHNVDLKEEEEFKEATDSSSSGAFDVPAFGKTTKGGRKNPLKIDGPDSIYKGRAVKDKNFPKWGGPGGLFVKVKEKCKKFPYCNQGNTGALEFIKEDEEITNAITEISKKYGIPHKEVENIVLNEINKIFI